MKSWLTAAMLVAAVPDLDATIAHEGLAGRAALLKLHLRPRLTLTRTLVPDASLPVGASKLGGLPDLPAPWRPAYGPLLAQIRLADLPPTGELPKDGWLAFFRQAVVYTPAGAVLQRRQATPVYHAARLGFTREPMLPPEPPPGLELVHPERYDRLAEALAGSDAGRHQLLGFCPGIQDTPTSDKLTLLAKLASDEPVYGEPWGDDGELYYLLSPADLRARRFERTRVSEQDH